MSVVKLNNCEAFTELDPKENVSGVAQEIQKLTCWEGWNVEATYLLFSKKQLMDLVREQDEGQERQESIESKHKVLRQEQEEYWEQLTQLLASIRSEISSRPTQMDIAPVVQGIEFPTP